VTDVSASGIVRGEELDASTTDQCFRCGYDLRGVADDQPCPECGLLAARSRRPTDELHHTRPGWLRRLSWGTGLILLAMLLGVVWQGAYRDVTQSLMQRSNTANSAKAYYQLMQLTQHASWIGWDVSAVLLLFGVVLLTGPERYPPADRADRRRRWALRVAALLPLALVGVQHVLIENTLRTRPLPAWYDSRPDPEFVPVAVQALLVAGCAALPLLLFLQLRSLAKRARSAHLAEHCAIVGVGNSLTLLYVAACFVIIEYAAAWGWGYYWIRRSPVALGLVVAIAVVSILFALWNAYLLVRFSVAFAGAARKLRRQWMRDDRAVAT
jgi:hypothetical protein